MRRALTESGRWHIATPGGKVAPDDPRFEMLWEEWDAWHQGQPAPETPQDRADMLRSEGDG